MRSPDAAPQEGKSGAGAQRESREDFRGSDWPAASGELLESCRAYLLLVANHELEPGLRAKVAPSDVVQETFLNAERKWAGFRGSTRDELKAWLRRILLNKLTDIRREFYDAKKRAVTREQSLEGDGRAQGQARDVAADLLSPRASMIARDEMAIMQEALERLPEDYRMVIVLRSLEQLSFAEVSQELNRSENATRKLWSRAVVRLRDELSALDGDPSR